MKDFVEEHFDVLMIAGLMFVFAGCMGIALHAANHPASVVNIYSFSSKDASFVELRYAEYEEELELERGLGTDCAPGTQFLVPAGWKAERGMPKYAIKYHKGGNTFHDHEYAVLYIGGTSETYRYGGFTVISCGQMPLYDISVP